MFISWIRYRILQIYNKYPQLQFSFNAPSGFLGTGTSKSPRTVRRHSGGRLLPTPTHYSRGQRRGSFQDICNSAVSFAKVFLQVVFIIILEGISTFCVTLPAGSLKSFGFVRVRLHQASASMLRQLLL